MNDDLPSKEEILKLFNEYIDKGDYKTAAKIVAYYSVAKIDPDVFADGLVRCCELLSKENLDEMTDTEVQAKIKEITEIVLENH